jgi:hypothetical protein
MRLTSKRKMPLIRSCMTLTRPTMKSWNRGTKKWLDEAKRSMPTGGAFSKKFIDDFHVVICSPWSLHVL